MLMLLNLSALLVCNLVVTADSFHITVSSHVNAPGTKSYSSQREKMAGSVCSKGGVSTRTYVNFFVVNEKNDLFGAVYFYLRPGADIYLMCVSLAIYRIRL